MPDELTLRRYEPRDADPVWRVHEAALRASPIPFVDDAPADEPLRDVEAHYLEAGGEFLVGTVDGEVVAVGGFVPASDDTAGTGAPDAAAGVARADAVPDRDVEPVAELRHVRVHPEYQRRGYGSELVAALERRARVAGFAAVELETVEHLEAAVALYRDAGYEVVERGEHPETGDELFRLRREL